VGRYFWWGGEVNRRMKKIEMGFKRMGFLVHVRRLRKLAKLTTKFGLKL
jgi:hypothetical protein